ncbi:MAG: hypothetical protein GX265_00465 [Mollicutes bacterium]|nr:hypothetical protein [Mollicutes bacterium]
MTQGIKTIDIIFEDDTSISIDSILFSNFYISNIDEEAKEIPYEKLFNSNRLYANFITMRISNAINEYYKGNVIKKIYDKKNISEIIINTINNKKIFFNIASSIDPFKNEDINLYDQSFIEDDDLCLLITPYKIKYKNHLFA